MKVRVYIKSAEMVDYLDITSDVVAISSISERLEASEFQSGTYRVSDFSFTVINRNGIYSDVGNVNSMFVSRRTNTLVKITYSEEIEDGICGFGRCGYVLCGTPADIETVVFEGLLSDEASTESVEDQEINFKVLGNQTIPNRTEAPTVTAGQSFETIITNCLNACGLTIDSLTTGNNQTIDVWTLQNSTVKTVLDLMLSASNSVMRVVGTNVVVENRALLKTAVKTFYGQASTNGQEDIIAISDALNGLNRTNNFISWAESANNSKDTASISKYGVRSKEVQFDFITDSGKKDNILDSLLETLSTPKKEFDLTVPLTYENVALNMLDVIKVDYPTPLYAPIGQNLAIYGVAVYGQDFYPYGDFTILIDVNDNWKIQSRVVDFNNGKITLKLRQL